MGRAAMQSERRPDWVSTAVEPMRSGTAPKMDKRLEPAQAGNPPVAVRPRRVRQRYDATVWTDTSAPPKTGLCDRSDRRAYRCLPFSGISELAAAWNLTKKKALPTPKSLSAIVTYHRKDSPYTYPSGGIEFGGRCPLPLSSLRLAGAMTPQLGNQPLSGKTRLTNPGVAGVDQ